MLLNILSDACTWFASDSIHLVDFAAALLGLCYLYLEYRANIWLWFVSVVMPICHAIVYFRVGLFADFGMEFVYVIIAFYGWASWRFGNKANPKEEKPITHFPKHLLAPMAMAFIVTWVAIWWLLAKYTTSNVPVADSFTTALSILAYFSLARKWAEQWLLWFVVDIVCTGLYMYKGIPFSACLYAIYTIVAVFGYMQWLRLMKEQPQA